MNKKTKVVGIIQARMGSTRLPEKMLLNLGNYPIIEWGIFPMPDPDIEYYIPPRKINASSILTPPDLIPSV